MAAYSMDLRERIVKACGAGESQASVALRFGVSSKTVSAYLTRASQGQLAPYPLPGRAPRLRPDQEAAFVAMLEERSDWSVDALCLEWETRCGVLLPRSTLHDHLKRLGGRYKKRAASLKNAVR